MKPVWLRCNKYLQYALTESKLTSHMYTCPACTALHTVRGLALKKLCGPGAIRLCTCQRGHTLLWVCIGLLNCTLLYTNSHYYTLMYCTSTAALCCTVRSKTVFNCVSVGAHSFPLQYRKDASDLYTQFTVATLQFDCVDLYDFFPRCFPINLA